MFRVENPQTVEPEPQFRKKIKVKEVEKVVYQTKEVPVEKVRYRTVFRDNPEESKYLAGSIVLNAILTVLCVFALLA